MLTRQCLATSATIALLAAFVIPASADGVTVTEQEGEWAVSAATYEATVAADGAMTSLRVRGEAEPLEFLVSRQGSPRGMYPYLKGILPLAGVEQPEPGVITAATEQAKLRYQFAADAITVTLENLAAEQMSLLGIFLPEVNVISDDFDFFYRLPDYREKLRSYEAGDNSQIKAKLDELLADDCALARRFHEAR